MSRHLAVKLLSSYIDEEVSPAQLRLVEGHLGDCRDCRRRLAGLRTVAAGVRRLEAVAPPPALSAAVERRVRLASLEEPGRFRLEDGLKRWVGQPVLAPALAIILALGAILYLFAFGASEVGRQTTRFVVVAAPSEEDTDSLGRRNESQTASDVPASKIDHDKLGAAEGEMGSGEGRLADSRRKLTAKLEEIQAESAEVTDRPARLKATESTEAAVSAADPEEMAVAERRALLLRKLSDLKEDVEVEGARLGWAVSARTLAGRTFVQEDGFWVEVGLAGEPAEEILDLRQDSASIEVELLAFRELGRVRLRVDDRVVEVIYADGPARD